MRQSEIRSAVVNAVHLNGGGELEKIFRDKMLCVYVWLTLDCKRMHAYGRTDQDRTQADRITRVAHRGYLKRLIPIRSWPAAPRRGSKRRRACHNFSATGRLSGVATCSWSSGDAIDIAGTGAVPPW